ncbi:regulator of sirC expression with transglutaminase-like and TPR domain [Humitalea rosea]|uniref:Regulator of sirC expression with transglutaminase-like and TPR domain n=1 Tax=Humitalea rosea TaxID=990373 RepID=A0A2W7KGQ7_9PROT|nr:tetratricopeptide repeat protein [Humitalea rosea]PZW47003.1 regulator of sirC expression with transglutaminase-like and TPR domain [Humitalea rosea]
MSDTDPRAALDAAGQLPDDELDVATIALHFARLDAPDADWHAATLHLSDIARAATEAASLNAAADEGDAEARRVVLARLIHEHFGYHGDVETYEDVANANLLRVIERRRGLPVVLGVLWMHAADAAGWPTHGLDFPGHFFLSMEGVRGQSVLDPFSGGAAMDAPALRAMLKRIEGPKAELRPSMVAPVERRAVLLRLQNNIKIRRLKSHDMEGAVTCVEDMLRLAPDSAALWREAGLMNQRLDRIGAALTSLERFLRLVPTGEAADRVRGVMEELRQRLN